MNHPRRFLIDFARLPPALIGILFMLAATVGFATMHGAVRYLSYAAETPLHPFEVAFFRNFFGLMSLAPWFLHRGLAPLRTSRLGLHLTRALINVVAMLMFFMGLSLTPIAEVQALSFTAPLFASLGAVLFLGERMRLWRWAALIVGIAGTLMIIRPGFATVEVGAILVVASAATWSLALLVIKALARTDSSVTITSYMALLMTPLSLLPALFVWAWPSGGQWAVLVVVGVVGTLAQMAMAQAFRMTDATVVLPLDFAKLIWGAGIGFMIFGEVPDVWTWIGGATIFAGATYLAVRESRHNAAARSVAAADPRPAPPA